MTSTKTQQLRVIKQAERRGTPKRMRTENCLLLHHGIDQRIELADLFHLDVGLVGMPAAHYVHRRSVFELDRFTRVAISVHLGGELTLGIDDEGQTYFVFGGEFLGIAAQ